MEGYDWIARRPTVAVDVLLIEQRACFLHVSQVEAFGEPIVDGRVESERLWPFIALGARASEMSRRSQLIHARPLGKGNLDCPRVVDVGAIRLQHRA